MFSQCNDTNKAGSEGHRAKSLVLKSQVLSLQWVTAFSTPTTPSKLGHHRGNAGKLPKVEGIVGRRRTEWLRSIQEVSVPFPEQSSSYLWQTTSRPLATNQSGLWALLLLSKIVEARSVLSPWNLIRACGLVILTRLSHFLPENHPVLYRSVLPETKILWTRSWKW